MLENFDPLIFYVFLATTIAKIAIYAAATIALISSSVKKILVWYQLTLLWLIVKIIIKTNSTSDLDHKLFYADAKQHFSNRSNDVYLWKVTHEKWKCFDDVRAEGLFFDVVLKSTDGKAFPAHRIILCACSPYFK